MVSSKIQTQNPRIILAFFIICLPTLWYLFDDPQRLLQEIRWSKKCDIFSGKWIPFPDGPLYVNSTCPDILDQQNCMKYGRPDSEFLKWRWKPYHCDLPVFHAWQFLELVRGKSLAFVGDSVGRNQMQSLMCLLAKEAKPVNMTHTKGSKSSYWHYKDYNFTIASFWSPYLVKAIDISERNTSYNRLVKLYLDEANPEWASKIETFDYVVISAVRWFFGPQMYIFKNKTIGCYMCENNQTQKFSMYYGYREAYRTSLEAIIRLENFRGVTFLRTLSPAHYENGEWNKGGSCPRTEPVLENNSVKLSEPDMEMYKIQKDVITNVQRRGSERGLKFELIDATMAMLVRPDGHPNHYGHWPSENKTIADCVHWCLPGPIDTWNEFLFYMLWNI